MAAFFGKVDAFLSEHKTRFNEVFSKHDKDKNGALDAAEAESAVREFVGQSAPQDEVDGLCARLQRETQGRLMCDAFLDFLAKCRNEPPPPAPTEPPPVPAPAAAPPAAPKSPAGARKPRSFDELMDGLDAYLQANEKHVHELFAKHDADNSGELDMREAEALCRELLGELVGELGHDARRFMEECVALLDMDNDGRIGFDEMLKAIKAVWGRAEDAVSEEEIVKRIRTLLKRHSGGLSALYATHANTARGMDTRALMRFLKSLYGVDIVGTHVERHAFRGELRDAFAVIQRRCDRDHDGFVTYFELREALYGERQRQRNARLAGRTSDRRSAAFMRISGHSPPPLYCEKDTMRERYIRDQYSSSIDEEEHRRRRVREIMHAQKAGRGGRMDLSFNSQALSALKAEVGRSSEARTGRTAARRREGAKAPGKAAASAAARRRHRVAAEDSDNLLVLLHNAMQNNEAQLFRSFQEFDRDRSGFLDLGELRAFFAAVLPPPDHALLTDDGPATPPSRVFASAVYSNTYSYAAILAPTFYFANDDRRFEIPLIYGRVNNDVDDFLTGEQVLFESKFTAIAPVYRWRIRGRTYLGAQAQISDVAYTARDEFSDDYLQRVEAEDATQTGIGAVLTRDTRDNQLYPFSGSYAELNGLAYTGLFSNDVRYETLKGEFKKFVELGPEKILAWRLFGQFGFGDLEYGGKAQLGRFSDLRGYTAGENFADNLITAQVEYRFFPWPRVGFVVFGGYSALYDGNWSDVDDAEYFGSVGGGIRVRILQSQRVNFRVDFAWGDDEDAYYVSLREAF